MSLSKQILGLAVAVVIGFPAFSQAADNAPTSKDKDAIQRIEFFAARQAGMIDVNFIPRNSKQANILIRNNTNKPIALNMPQAFGGIPVVGQFGGGGGMGGGGMGGMGGGGMGGGGMGGGGGGQGMGGGMGGGGGGGGMGGGGMGGGGMGGGGMGGGGGGGFFNVEPNKVRRIKVNTVCLEHGKKEPSPRVKYEIVPIEWMTNKQEVAEICKMLGTGKLSQSVAQAAAWHYSDNMSWQELSQKVGRIHFNGLTEPYFQRQEVMMGMQLANVAHQRAQQYIAASRTRRQSTSASLKDQ
jgi:hypothetical protein